jgi:hypothetical protein
MPAMSSGPAGANGPAALSGNMVSAWYTWVGWLPSPLRVVTLVIATWVVLRLVFRYGAKPLAAVGGWLAGTLLRLLTWLAITPEYAITSFTNHYWDRNPPGSFIYGEAVAGFVEAGKVGVTRVSVWLSRVRNSPGKTAFWLIVVVLLLVNLAAYHAHAPLPVKNWWHSVTAWITSLQHQNPGQQG